jgi:rhodanese-related sulfurtransferase
VPKEISKKDLKEKMDNKHDFVLIEALHPHEYKRGHIKGAINIQYTNIGSHAHEQIPDTSKEIIVYCNDYDCNASHIAAAKLEQLGYSNVLVYPGGKKEWMESGFPMERS